MGSTEINDAAETIAATDQVETDTLIVSAEREPGRPAVVELLWNERHFLSRATLVALLASLLLAFVIPKEYESAALVVPNSETTSLAMAAAMTARVSGLGSLGSLQGLLGGKTPGGLTKEIIESRTLEDRIVDRFDLMKRYRKRYRQDAREKLAKHISVAEDLRSGVITVRVGDRDPQVAAAMARAVIDELNSIAARLNTSAAHREREFIEGRLREVKQELDQAETDLAEFSSKNTTVDIKEQTKAMVDAAALLQGQLITAQSELRGLEQIYTGENVRVRSVHARIAELQAQLNKLGGSADAPTTQLYPSIRQLPKLGVRYMELYRRAKVDETVYDLLTQQYEMARIEEAKELPTVRVLDQPNVPERKTFPPRLLLVVLCTLVATFLAMVAVLARQFWSEISPDDPYKRVALEMGQAAAKSARRLRRSRA